MAREDPGLCPICDAPHCGCLPVGGALESVVVLGQRDATAQSVEPPAELAPIVPEPVPAPFSTSDYKRSEHGLKRPRHQPPPNRGADR